MRFVTAKKYSFLLTLHRRPSEKKPLFFSIHFDSPGSLTDCNPVLDHAAGLFNAVTSDNTTSNSVHQILLFTLQMLRPVEIYFDKKVTTVCEFTDITVLALTVMYVSVSQTYWHH
jgi:hypothetical protein